MGKTVSITKSGFVFSFDSSSRWTKHGFAHDCNLLIYDNANFKTIATIDKKRFYLNRTWEVYTYQSVMLDAIMTEIESVKTRCKERYKASHNLQVLRGKKHNDALNSIFENDPYLKACEECCQTLRNEVF